MSLPSLSLFEPFMIHSLETIIIVISDFFPNMFMGPLGVLENIYGFEFSS